VAGLEGDPAHTFNTRGFFLEVYLCLIWYYLAVNKKSPVVSDVWFSASVKDPRGPPAQPRLHRLGWVKVSSPNKLNRMQERQWRLPANIAIFRPADTFGKGSPPSCEEERSETTEPGPKGPGFFVTALGSPVWNVHHAFAGDRVANPDPLTELYPLSRIPPGGLRLNFPGAKARR